MASLRLRTRAEGGAILDYAIPSTSGAEYAHVAWLPKGIVGVAYIIGDDAFVRLTNSKGQTWETALNVGEALALAYCADQINGVEYLALHNAVTWLFYRRGQGEATFTYVGILTPGTLHYGKASIHVRYGGRHSVVFLYPRSDGHIWMVESDAFMELSTVAVDVAAGSSVQSSSDLFTGIDLALIHLSGTNRCYTRTERETAFSLAGTVDTVDDAMFGIHVIADSSHEFEYTRGEGGDPLFHRRSNTFGATWRDST